MLFNVDYSKEEGNVFISADDGSSGATYKVDKDDVIRSIAIALETYIENYYAEEIGGQGMEFKGFTLEPVYNENGEEAYQQYTMNFEEVKTNE